MHTPLIVTLRLNLNIKKKIVSEVKQTFENFKTINKHLKIVSEIYYRFD